MTSYPTLVLIRGAWSIDLNDRVAMYLRTDFVPPETVMTPQIAAGSAANWTGGRLVGRKPQTRTLTFSVRVVGSSESSIVNALRAVKAMLVQAGDASMPVVVKYAPNSDTPEPVWGQFGARLSYEVLAGRVTIGPDYMRAERRSKAVTATFELTIQPFASGKQQRLCSAVGGVFEDTIGMVDGRSRGIAISEATTNKIINPVFGYSTYDNGWTAAAGVVQHKNIDPAYAMFGAVSARLVATGAAAFYVSVNVGNTNTHTLSFYVKKIDGSAVTNADVRPRYDASIPSDAAYTSVGNGWYRVVKSFTGINASVVCGVHLVAAGVTVYVTGFQLEEKSYATPLANGDMLGCAWTSTAHASTSTRTAAAVKISTDIEFFSNVPVTVRVVFRTSEIAAAHDTYLMDLRDGSHTSAPYLYIASGATRVSCVYNGNLVQSQVLSANTWYVAHMTISAAGSLNLYVNATNNGGAAAAGAVVFGANLFIGSNYSSASQADTTIGGLAVFPYDLTAAQIALDYANMAPLLAAGLRVEGVPYLWTKDGDDKVDNCNDSTRDNWCVAGGVEGSSAARTTISMQLSEYLSSAAPIGLSLLDVERFSNAEVSALMADETGTVDAGSCGGSYEAVSVATSETGPSNFITGMFKPLAGRAFVLVTRIKNAGSNLLERGFITIAGSTQYSDWKAVANNAAYRLNYTNDLRMPDDTDAGAGLLNVTKTFSAGIGLKRSSGGAANVDVDFVQLLPRPLALLSPANPTSTAGIIVSGERVYTLDQPLIGVSTTVSDFYDYARLMGDVIEFRPDRLNVMFSFIALNAVANPALADAIYYQRVMVTPRYELA